MPRTRFKKDIEFKRKGQSNEEVEEEFWKSIDY